MCIKYILYVRCSIENYREGPIETDCVQLHAVTVCIRTKANDDIQDDENVENICI